MWDNRTRRYAVLEKKIIFEKNKKNGTVYVFQATQNMLDSIKRDIEKWNQTKGVYDKDELWKPEFNYYITPQISKFEGICSVDDLIGKWIIVFRETDYPNLNFEITKEVISGTNIESVC